MFIGESLHRSVDVVDVALDVKGVLEGIFVPWDSPTTVYGEGDAYKEGFKRGAFDLQFDTFPDSVHSVALRPEHGSSEYFGTTRQLANSDAGLHGIVQILPSRVDDVRAMVDAGVKHMSIEFKPLQRSPRVGQDGVRWRTAAFLEAVALVATPSYADAKVLALREADLLQEQEAKRVENIEKLQAEIEQLKSSRWATV